MMPPPPPPPPSASSSPTEDTSSSGAADNDNHDTDRSAAAAAAAAAADEDAAASAAAAAAILVEAKELRLALEDQLERVRSLTFEEHLEFSVEERLSELILLVSQYSDEALHRALVLALGSPDADGYTGRYPLHLACDTNAPVEIIRFFLQHEPTRQAVKHKDKWEDLPLHTACSRKDYTLVVELLLEYDDDDDDDDAGKCTIFTPRYDGSLPIHTACRYNAPPRVIQLLLDCDTTPERKTLFVDSLYGQVPLHVACRCNLNPASLQLLLDYDVDKKSVLLLDNADRLPLHVAFLFCPTTTANNQQQQQQPTAAAASSVNISDPQQHHGEHSSIELILRAMIHGRIERVGLNNWKHDMHTFLDRLRVPDERNVDASYNLELTCDALQMLLERAILLELAIWKTSCGGSGLDLLDENGEAQARSMKELSDDYKRERHITSGAEMIIPGVLSFLEDEPIAALLEQMGF